MKLTQALWHQHIGRRIRSLWHVTRERRIRHTNGEKVLSSLGIKVKDPSDILEPKREFERITCEPYKRKVCFDETHPDWKDRACLLFKDENVLQAGSRQAFVLTNTIKLQDAVPERVANLIPDVPNNVENIIKRIIYTSTMFDAHQEKLPKLKDPERPAWNFPRVYGLTNIRKIRNLSKKFVQLCESLCGPDISRNRSIVHDGLTTLYIEKEADLLQFALTADLMITSSKPLAPIEGYETGTEIEFPNLYPLHFSLGLGKTNIYKSTDLYPVDPTCRSPNVHTIFAHHDTERVKNKTELPVREDQIIARSLIKSFTAAATCARQKYGSDVEELPQPVVVQCVQSDGCNFHFSVFQLNNLNLNDVKGRRNFWWSLPMVKLYENARYEGGRPVLEGYNPDVFRTIFAFYKNN